jgi:hypothetical protein
MYGFKKLYLQATTTLKGGWGLTKSMCARFIGNSNLDPLKL